VSPIDIAEAVPQEMEEENPRMAEKVRALGLEVYVTRAGPGIDPRVSPFMFKVGTRKVSVVRNYGIFTVSLLTLYRASATHKQGRTVSAHNVNRAIERTAQMIFTAARTQ